MANGARHHGVLLQDDANFTVGGNNGLAIEGVT
jgi:hypothetical protein